MGEGERAESVSALVVELGAEDVFRQTEALAGEAQDGGAVDEAIDGGHRLRLAGEEALPATEAGVGGE